MTSLRPSTPAWFIAGAILLVVPLFLEGYSVFLATELLIWALFAVSLDLLLGYTGLPSFGHAVFFGVPAYAFGMVLVRQDSLALAVLAGYCAVAVVALLVGYFALRTGGTGYIIVTLLASFAFFTFVLTATGLTGGEDGLRLPRDRSFAALDPRLAYGIVASVSLLLFLLARWVVRSNVGHLLAAIRSNERRVQAMGYHVDAAKLLVTLVSAFIAGTAGMLYALLSRTLSAELVGPALSTEVVIWVLLGGVQTLVGPIVGAAAFMGLKQLLSSTTWYPLLLGLVFIAIVLWAPRGLVSLLARRAPRHPSPTTGDTEP